MRMYLGRDSLSPWSHQALWPLLLGQSPLEWLPDRRLREVEGGGQWGDVTSTKEAYFLCPPVV